MKLRIFLALLLASPGFGFTRQAQSVAPSSIVVPQSGNLPALTVNQQDTINNPPAIKIIGSGGIQFGDGTIQTTAGGGVISYTPPGVTISGGAALLELGTITTSRALTCNTVKNSNNITTLSFFRGVTLIYSYPSPNPSGGAQIYTDTGTVTTSVNFSCTVGDGTQTTNSNIQTAYYVYPFYYGVGAQGLSGVSIQALTKLIQNQQNTTTITSPTNQVFYFAYPAAYGNLTSILDPNGFQTISGYTLRTVSLTMLDATNQTYNVYEFNTPTTQTNFSNTYKF